MNKRTIITLLLALVACSPKTSRPSRQSSKYRYEKCRRSC